MPDKITGLPTNAARTFLDVLIPAFESMSGATVLANSALHNSCYSASATAKPATW
ncbi:MAG TPA: hypothetical protein VK642_15900 [Burkholderiales bacterium]|nr:hypothetical protein [Burkholderiales bacterium]